MSDHDRSCFAMTGMIVGGIASVVMFIAVYIAAVGSVDWVIGRRGAVVGGDDRGHT